MYHPILWCDDESLLQGISHQRDGLSPLEEVTQFQTALKPAEQTMVSCLNNETPVELVDWPDSSTLFWLLHSVPVVQVCQVLTLGFLSLSRRGPDPLNYSCFSSWHWFLMQNILIRDIWGFWTNRNSVQFSFEKQEMVSLVQWKSHSPFQW